MTPRLRRRDRVGLRDCVAGTSAIETALLMLPFLAMLYGGLEIARYTWTRLVLQQVAYAGARCAGLRAVSCSNAPTLSTEVRVYDPAKTSRYILATASARMVNLPSSEVTVNAVTSCSGNANFVQVVLNHRFGSAFLDAAGLDDATITASACFPQQS